MSIDEQQTNSAEFEEQLKKEMEEEEKLILEEQTPSIDDTDSDQYFAKSEYETDTEEREIRKKK